MQARIEKVHFPKTAKELTALLEKGKGRVAPVGGGVSFSFSIPPKVTELASLKSLGLDRITLDRRGLRIGAMATIAHLAASREAAGFRNGLFASAASRVAATTNRNLITVGGNALRLFIWSDLPLAYCAAEALFKVRGPKGVRTLSCDEIYGVQPLAALKRAEYLEEIIVPPARGRSGAAFEKFSETANTFALVSAAACVTVDTAGRCVSARLAVGGLQLLPRVREAAEKHLKGALPSPERIGGAAAAALASAKLVRDIRVSEGYKRELASVIARRALERAFDAAARGN